MVKEWLAPKGEAKPITREVKAQMEGILTESEVTVFVYPLMDFNHQQILPRIHKEKVKMVKEFEKYVIHWFSDSGYNLINGLRAHIVFPMEKLFPDRYDEICKDFPALN